MRALLIVFVAVLAGLAYYGKFPTASKQAALAGKTPATATAAAAPAEPSVVPPAAPVTVYETSRKCAPAGVVGTNCTEVVTVKTVR
ncbi:hypothetical protein A33M_0895 [Rhodovulum sp. PH10]|uniref:hypothetical protein n=1 Tax=Rhodovulum sp. PH10 TaxID=1187851 RepID=UPI00027C2EB3|nr:hypothetical protein [Rhodovulum sp. PH10]EJW09800.1 hypothetical protein A33M_0895 [Rhodovulum sp. PH10]